MRGVCSLSIQTVRTGHTLSREIYTHHTHSIRGWQGQGPDTKNEFLRDETKVLYSNKCKTN